MQARPWRLHLVPVRRDRRMPLPAVESHCSLASVHDQRGSGNLPAFSVITPSGSHVGDSEHNGFSITAGDDWIGKIAATLMNGPEWGSTVLFITWDDCGCFYDHARPGINPDGTRQGPRVPLVIISPYVKR